jgi:hypothetical protein
MGFKHGTWNFSNDQHKPSGIYRRASHGVEKVKIVPLTTRLGVTSGSFS